MKIVKQTAKQFSLLTGLQPTGSLHLGNYLGSIKTILNFQKQQQFKTFYLSIVDYHSLTNAVQYNHSKISFNSKIGQDTFAMAKLFIASGVDPQKTTIFVQSHVNEHATLCWILSCLCPQHWLNTMIQFKEKSHSESSVGIYTYPILMAADIMLYRVTHVPVGEDQKQHLQLTQKITKRVNTILKNDFFPHVRYVKAMNPKVMSLMDPNKKMSKSDSNDRSRINLTDEPATVIQKIRRAVTDTEGQIITYQPQRRKGLSNLIDIYASLDNQEIPQNTLTKLGNIGIAEFKSRLSQKINFSLGQIQYNMKNISEQQVKRMLKIGKQRAQIVAQQNIREIKSMINLFS